MNCGYQPNQGELLMCSYDANSFVGETGKQINGTCYRRWLIIQDQRPESAIIEPCLVFPALKIEHCHRLIQTLILKALFWISPEREVQRGAKWSLHGMSTGSAFIDVTGWWKALRGIGKRLIHSYECKSIQVKSCRFALSWRYLYCSDSWLSLTL